MREPAERTNRLKTDYRVGLWISKAAGPGGVPSHNSSPGERGQNPQQVGEGMAIQFSEGKVYSLWSFISARKT